MHRVQMLDIHKAKITARSPYQFQTNREKCGEPGLSSAEGGLKRGCLLLAFNQDSDRIVVAGGCGKEIVTPQDILTMTLAPLSLGTLSLVDTSHFRLENKKETNDIVFR